jgi:putative ABC transport system substrate-binding protein
MRRRDFMTLVASATVAWPFGAGGQEAGRTYRLGILWPFPYGTPESSLLADALRPYGFIDGKNLNIDYRPWAQHVDQIRNYAAEFAKERVDAISAGGDLAIRAAQKATPSIPIVGVTDDMLGSGFVPSFARPTGNATGVSILSPELDGKRQDILIEALPGLNHLALLADSNTSKQAHLDVLRKAARARNIESSIHLIAKPEEIAPAIDAAKAAGAAALNVLASPILNSNRHVIIARVAAQRLPAIFHWPETAEEGGFAAYGPRFDQIIRELHARQVAQILRGGKIADIPVEQPTKFELVINLHTATALGIAVPPTLLARADKVIE